MQLNLMQRLTVFISIELNFLLTKLSTKITHKKFTTLDKHLLLNHTIDECFNLSRLNIRLNWATISHVPFTTTQKN